MKDGFTLLEIMIVVVIISILVLIFTFPLQGHIGDTEAHVQQVNSSLLETSIKEYKMDTDQFPFGPKIKIEVSTESKKIIQSLLDQKGTGKNFEDIQDSFYTLDLKKLRSYVKGNFTDMERYFSSVAPEIEGLVFTYKTVQNKNKKRFSGSYTLVETKPCSSDSSTDNKVQLPKNGDGTSYNPFVIKTIGELQSIKLSPSSFFILGNDIEACVTRTWNNGKGFEPIGNFSGGLRKSNFSINNLYINRPSEDEVGLFKTTKITPSNSISIRLKNVIIAGNNYVGSLSGVNEVENVMYDIQAENVSVTGNDHVGGIFGKTEGLIFSISGTGTVEGRDFVGGLTGELTKSGIQDSYFIGKVSGNNNVGGLSGRIDPHTLLLRIYASAEVTGKTNIQPIIGAVDSTNPDLYVYYNKDKSNTPSSLGTGKTTTEMKIQSTYSGFNFIGSWGIDPLKNDGLPYLK
ncbi:prepilin-type N-terminal cleavage/methylation domain-containing protein [Bacillus cereus]|uniref:prepilin-type N-terminal cleavage/methylation domain-containing protein n=1 Tax=Bacillus cereus TaxID=1396 RepID=UPI0018A7C516|nr:prepilin-type N-terminal cleavage/methylation domain-containing protein [Bacillus cereus]MBF8118122.1 prepilin-type N-terminal cleavage/methylation domain-containing protein [Bacillus cereus]